MKRLLIVGAAMLTAVAIAIPASASGAAKGTKEGPYGPVTFQDYGTCQNLWSDMTQKTTYVVGKASKGVTPVTMILSGPFKSIAGQSPGACNDGTDNGNTITKGIKGSVKQTFYLEITNGKFNPKAKCDDSCATDYNWDGVFTFVSKFFKSSATWTFSATKMAHEVVTSTDKKLCADKWVVDYNPADGTIVKVTGDIATKCH